MISKTSKRATIAIATGVGLVVAGVLTTRQITKMREDKKSRKSSTPMRRYMPPKGEEETAPTDYEEHSECGFDCDCHTDIR